MLGDASREPAMASHALVARGQDLQGMVEGRCRRREEVVHGSIVRVRPGPRFDRHQTRSAPGRHNGRMWTDAIFAYLHFTALFVFFAFLSIETWLLRTPVDGARAAELALADRWYWGSFAAVLVTDR